MPTAPLIARNFEEEVGLSDGEDDAPGTYAIGSMLSLNQSDVV